MKDKSLQTLIIDDSEDDVLLIIRELKRGGYDPVYERVETAEAMEKSLEDKQWDIILCDYKMPNFSAPSAISLLKKTNIDIPIIIISGAIGEETAVECMRLGARDYIMKGNFSRLCPAIARELEEAKVRNKQKQAEEALRKSEKLFKEITENSSDILIISDENGKINYSSRSVERFTGYKPEEIVGRSAFTFIHPDDLERAVDDYCKAILSKDNILIHNGFRIVHKDGSEVYMDGLGKNLLNNPDIAGFVMNIRDVTEQKRADEKLQQEQERFRALAELSPDIILLINREGIIIYENPALEKILGYNVEERIGRNAFENVHPDDLNIMTEAFNTLIKDQDSPAQKSEIRIRHSNGNWRTFEVAASNLKRGNVVEALIINLHDITERKKAEDALKASKRKYRELSMIDDLTQLFNSRNFYAQLKKEIERSNRYGNPLTLLLLDIDKFKDFNDTYGHVEGDYVLARLGQVIKRCLRETDSAYRYGGEEFTVMLPMTTCDDGIITAKRIQAELSKEGFSPALGQKIYMTVSVGVSQYNPQEEIKAFVQRVDQLMYKVKKKERGKICSDNGNMQ
jgi:diguanylate cyclase (GGDEF)-like protein/PAS domain S-box-containing protein